MSQITFAKVAGPPDSWCTLQVLNRSTGLEVRDVVEVDTVEGYVIRLRRDVRGKLVPNTLGDGPAQERITGDFEIRADGQPALPHATTSQEGGSSPGAVRYTGRRSAISL